jgi:2-oxoglutarate ferredoxin oxidoreductase subunit gamma
MENRIIVCGFGGQGALLTGELLGYAANDSNEYAIFLPYYGPEQRGGTASCTVTLSDKPINSPVAAKVDTIICFNNPSLLKFIDRLKKKGILFINSDLCTSPIEREDIQVFKIPADSIAEKIGSKKVANIVMLGAFIKQSGVLAPEKVIDTINQRLSKKAEFKKLNEEAFAAGMACVT